MLQEGFRTVLVKHEDNNSSQREIALLKREIEKLNIVIKV
jgi:hypothetical protein